MPIYNQDINREEFATLLRNNTGIIVMKFGAEWCGPCKRIKPYVYERMNALPDNVSCYDIDVDESFDLYAWMKSKKQVNGIPVLLAYYPGNTGPGSDLAITGADQDGVGYFFTEVERAALSLKIPRN